MLQGKHASMHHVGLLLQGVTDIGCCSGKAVMLCIGAYVCSLSAPLPRSPLSPLQQGRGVSGQTGQTVQLYSIRLKNVLPPCPMFPEKHMV